MLGILFSSMRSRKAFSWLLQYSPYTEKLSLCKTGEKHWSGLQNQGPQYCNLHASRRSSEESTETTGKLTSDGTVHALRFSFPLAIDKKHNRDLFLVTLNGLKMYICIFYFILCP